MSLIDNDENSAEWLDWIQVNLNKNNADGRADSGGGNYSLALQFGWSPIRISAVVLSPLLLSLAIGFWYMKVTGDVIAAWTISLYIVTSAAGNIDPLNNTCCADLSVEIAIIGLLTVLSSIGHR